MQLLLGSHNRACPCHAPPPPLLPRRHAGDIPPHMRALRALGLGPHAAGAANGDPAAAAAAEGGGAGGGGAGAAGGEGQQGQGGNAQEDVGGGLDNQELKEMGEGFVGGGGVWGVRGCLGGTRAY